MPEPFKAGGIIGLTFSEWEGRKVKKKTKNWIVIGANELALSITRSHKNYETGLGSVEPASYVLISSDNAVF